MSRRHSLLSVMILALAGTLLPGQSIHAQALTGALGGQVIDSAGGVTPGAQVRLQSPALFVGSVSTVTDERGRWRFTALPPGRYTLEIHVPGFALVREEITVGAAASLAVTIRLQVAGVAESVVVEGTGARIEARDSGFVTRFSAEEIRAIPTRRSSMFDAIRAAPGISPTSPSSGPTTNGMTTTVSAFGSGTNENLFLVDGTNFTCPCNGVARSEPGVDFIQEIQVQSIGASAEFGSLQGAVFNVVMKQGGERYLHEASYFGQVSALTSQPVRLPIAGADGRQSGYVRSRYRDFATSVGGPLVRERTWFFAGYQHLRDFDSQPGTDPGLPRTYEQDKVFGKVTWKLASRWQLVQSVHGEFWVNPSPPTRFTTYEATTRTSATVPAMTFAHLTHTPSASTTWDVRVGRFLYVQHSVPRTGDRTLASRFDNVTGVTRDAPPQFGDLTISRSTAKATADHYRPRVFGTDHQVRVGLQLERGAHDSLTITPNGVRFIDTNGRPFRAVSRDPSLDGGLFFSASAFASDAITLGDRILVNAGVRFDHSRAVSQNLHSRDVRGAELDTIVSGQGTLFTWNIVSPRLGITAKLTADSRTMLRASYGRFNQGMLTGEIAPFHPGVSSITTDAFEAATGGYTRNISTVDPRSNLVLDRTVRAPRTDEYSAGVDREVGRGIALAIAYVRKNGGNFIGWTDIGGQYQPVTRTASDGTSMTVFEIVNTTADRRFLLTNPADYSLTYNGMVVAAEKRRSRGWQARGSYTFSRASGLQPSSGTTAAGPQVSTVAPPNPITFGRDPNDLTNARGRLANDRPHIFRLSGHANVASTGFVLAASLQHFSGKPWAATELVSLRQGDVRVMVEPRGSRRLSSQTLLDVRLSKTVHLSRAGRIELLLDVLNVLNDSAEEGVATDNLASISFGQPTVFLDPRRAMLGIRLDLGK